MFQFHKLGYLVLSSRICYRQVVVNDFQTVYHLAHCTILIDHLPHRPADVPLSVIYVFMITHELHDRA